MTFIVMDLEWNQPLSYSSTAYKSVKGKLLFEMIQIGAVKLDDQMRVVDSFSQMIRPTCYIKLHPRIKRITQIEQDELDDAPQFSEALQNFESWCGKDFVLLTWGCDDISVLQQNLTFFQCENHLGPIYDMQRLFGELIGNSKERMGLKAAMEHFSIDPSEEKAFHNAENDAYYTALVFARFPEPLKVLQYPLTAKKLIHIDRRKKEAIAVFRAPKPVDECLAMLAATKPACPICGKKYELSAGYVKLGDARYQALAKCSEHGLMTVKMSFKKDETGKKIMERSIALADEQNKAYVATKIIQWQNKLAIQTAKEGDAK